MRLKLIACKEISEEIDSVESGNDYRTNDTKLNSPYMREGFDAVLLGYGLCSNVIAGMYSTKYTLVKSKMKKIIMLLLTMFLLNISSCTAGNVDYSKINALKISSYIFDEESGEDFFICNNFGLLLYNENAYIFERLKMNEIKLMPPLLVGGEMDMVNLNIYVEFDGIIEIISENQDVQLSVNPATWTEPFRQTEGLHLETGRIYDFDIRLTREGFISFNPLGSNRGHYTMVEMRPFNTGREYYLNVNAYKFANEKSPVIRARLKVVQLEDKSIYNTPDNPNSGCFSIELVFYEHSDTYKIMYGIDDAD